MLEPAPEAGGAGDHRRVVRAEDRGGHVHGGPERREALAQAAVGGHAAAERQALEARPFEGPLGAGHEAVDDRRLVRGREVGARRSDCSAGESSRMRIQQRRLQAGEGKVEAAARTPAGRSPAPGRGPPERETERLGVPSAASSSSAAPPG